MRRTGARVVHAHNVNPTLGWRALAAAREAGAGVVLHLHNYRLVCAVGTCFTHGEDCTRCHGRDTAPGVRLNCRGGSRAESAAYAAGLALHQRRLAAQADAFLVPSAFALRRLRALGAPVDDRASVLASVQRSFAPRSTAGSGRFAFAAGRLTAEKGFADAVAGCAAAGLPLVVAGDGPELGALRTAARAMTSPSRAGSPPPSSPRCGATPPWRSSPRATRRSCRSRRSRRWRPACRWSRPTRAASGRSSGPRVATRRGTRGRWARARRRCGATRRRAPRALATARELTSPAAVAARLRVVYDAEAAAAVRRAA